MQVNVNDYTIRATHTELKIAIPLSFKIAHLWAKVCGKHRFSLAIEYGYKVLRDSFPKGKYEIYHSLNDNELSFDIC